MKKGDFVEFAAGAPKGSHWNEDSIFLQDEVFGYIEPALSKAVPGLTRFGPNELPRATCMKAIVRLERLSKLLADAKSVSELDGIIQFADLAEGRNEFAQDFGRNKESLLGVISELTMWMNEKAKTHEVIWILGF
ncbi:MAG: hypothetical protein CO113_09320 [Elusimicrobia bacterium CG_4_9_14_3_um_filter_62_55]|nr:MAG: hypothetical protein COR54_16865 [Elusimicrobia bacterium CG22_combo_CG10-13_8_21_14_all_63_91]PJA16705.1 MAG: hypothetical protein COX66_06975 [Elusimicrobia bacterium CG_4_10_14_0_2_um_filter_63_34]PJB25337.1 MAG: hypothetical protein CO113_09320 [Elusimicrobia bacterium CG_4_9_14_3_um_filter_62_55]